MGVKLQGIITRKQVSIPNLAGKVIAIDAPNIIMQVIGYIRPNSEGIMIDRTQRAISHLYGLLYRVNFYYSKKIFPIFCFDGRDSHLKRRITKDQLNDFLITQKWYNEAIKKGDKIKAKKIALGKEFLWTNIIEESKKLLGLLGVPYITSPASAESQCAYLVKIGVVDYANSQDFDTLLFGCPRVIQNLSKSLKRKVQGRWTYKKIVPYEINLSKNLKRLGINQFELVDLGILVGTDYFPGIRGIGSKTALKLILEHKNIEKIIRKEKSKYDFSKLTPGLLQKIRKIFLLPDVVDVDNNLCWNAPNEGAVINLMCDDHTLNRERVENNVGKTEVNFNKCRDYFEKQKKTPKYVQKKLVF